MSSFARMLCNHFLVTWLAGCLRPIFGGLITGARGLFIKTIRWSITVGVELWSEQSLIYVRVTTRYTKISSKPGYPLTSVTRVCSHVGGVTWQEGHVNHESTTVNFPVINESMCRCVMVVWAALKLSRLVPPLYKLKIVREINIVRKVLRFHSAHKSRVCVHSPGLISDLVAHPAWTLAIEQNKTGIKFNFSCWLSFVSSKKARNWNLNCLLPVWQTKSALDRLQPSSFIKSVLHPEYPVNTLSFYPWTLTNTQIKWVEVSVRRCLGKRKLFTCVKYSINFIWRIDTKNGGLQDTPQS